MSMVVLDGAEVVYGNHRVAAGVVLAQSKTCT